MKSSYKRAVSLTMCAALATSAALPAFAADTEKSGKDEVVYVMTDAGGKVSGVYVVNIFDGGKMIDYGDYSDVKMLTTEDKISQNGDKITFSSDADRVYYQGTLKNTTIPWNISIRYDLDGKEYQPDELAGKSGSLRIHLKITENKSYEGYFYGDYALQTTFMLDTQKCSRIKAEDATMADVGSDKQLSYTILPGKGIDTEITADVKDFEMDAVSINGIRMNLDVEIDDEEMLNQIGDLIDGIVDLNTGAIELNDGAVELKDGSGSLKDGAADLSSGAAELDNGVKKLQSGIRTAQAGMKKLDAQSGTLSSGSSQMKKALNTINSSLSDSAVSADKVSELTAASGQIKSAISEITEGANSLQSAISYEGYADAMANKGIHISGLSAKDAQAASSLGGVIASLQSVAATLDSSEEYAAQAAVIRSQIGQLESTQSLMQANAAALAGTEAYFNALSGKAGELYQALAQLEKKYAEFDATIRQMNEQLVAIADNLTALTKAVNQVTRQYEKLDDGIQAYTAGVSQLVAGYSEIVDGVADLAVGSSQLRTGSNDLYSGSKSLYNGVASLCGGASQLADGTTELRGQTDGMDKEVEDKIDEMLSSIQGGDGDTVSFVSSKNTDVNAVQFVIKTDAIAPADEEETEEEPEPAMTFWDKVLNLFGLYDN